MGRVSHSPSPSPSPLSHLFNSSTFFDFVMEEATISLSESSSSLKIPNFASVSETLFPSCSETDSLFEAGSSFSLELESLFSFLCSSPVSSSLLRGEPQNLLASDEDLYGADLHLVNSKAFFGGVQDLEEEKAISGFTLSSYSDSSSSCSASDSSLWKFESDLAESSLCFVGFLRKLPTRKIPHLGQTGWQRQRLLLLLGLIRQNRAFFRIHQHRHRVRAPPLAAAAVVVVGRPLLASDCLAERLTRT